MTALFQKFSALMPLALVLLSGPVRADFFTFTDADGTIHFADEPPDHAQFSIYKLRNEDPFRIAAIRIPREELRKLISRYSSQYNVTPSLIEAVVKAESEYDPMAVSKKGARGLMQLMPTTAEQLGVFNPHDPKENLRGGIRYLKQLLEQFQGDVELAVAAYNAGPGAITKYGGVPPFPETVDYVKKVRKYYDRFQELTPVTFPHDVLADQQQPNPL
ncbi:MAG TPA: lytic transglycosylase domain-containing protein [Bdellovibrionota bacterium]|nr:lytic transglycosylase domain-containing protein [Bdellovibrionota bacterium]